MYCTRCGVTLARDSDRYCAQCGAPTANLAPPPCGAPRRLERSVRDSRLAGVCGGFAEYLGADPTLVRLLFVVATVFTGFVMGLVAYFACWIIMPKAEWCVPAPAAAPAAAPTPASPLETT